MTTPTIPNITKEAVNSDGSFDKQWSRFMNDVNDTVNGLQTSTTIDSASGGSNIDVEARVVLNEILTVMKNTGIISK